MRAQRLISAALISAALLALVLGAGMGTAHAGWARFALVVGYNQSDDPDLAPLRYADDDAVKHAALLGAMTERTVLLSTLDDDTRRMFGETVRPKAPTRANILSALASLHTDMAAAARRGDKPVLFFVYSGHGNYDAEGRGYVQVAGGRFTTRDMYFHVLGPSAGPSPHHVVLVVDACNAALLVQSRGGDRRRARRTTLRLEDYPNVGVILSASAVAEVHEWGRYLSGIFSHEVRSALLGPGDLNDDGRVTFAELAAFVASANQTVKNETYRLKPYIRPPLSAPNLPLMDFAAARFRARVRLGASFAGKAYLVNEELLRVADFNKAAGQGAWLGVPGEGAFSLVSGDSEFVIPADARGDLAVLGLKRRKRSVLAGRGAGAYFDQRLFATAQSPAAGRAWIAQRYLSTLAVERFEVVPWYKNAGAWSVMSAGVLGLGAGIAFHTTAFGQVGDGNATYWNDDRRALYDAAARNQAIASTLYGVGGAAILGGILWFAIERDTQTTRYEPPLTVEVTPGGVLLRSDF